MAAGLCRRDRGQGLDTTHAKESSMTALGITASVGRGGANRPQDVTIVQNLLVARGYTAIGVANGVCGKSTVDAIVDYQRGFFRKPDGLIEPERKTWRLLSATFTGRADAPPPGPAAPAAGPAPAGAGEAGSLTRAVPRPAPATINRGLSSPGNDFMLQKICAPLLDGGYTALCQTPTHPRLRRNLVTDTVGPFRVTGLVPAVLSLKEVMAAIEREQPAVHAKLGTAGMLCCRLVRGSDRSISNHSWGTAIDLTIDGVLDARGNDTMQFGLTLIAPIFNRHGWYWGAGFRTEDAMHFEAGKALIEHWAGQLA